jgi:hypothetical protein
MNIMKSLESYNFCAVNIYNTVADLLSWLCNPWFPFANEGCEAAMTNAELKLAEYVSYGKQLTPVLLKDI